MKARLLLLSITVFPQLLLAEIRNGYLEDIVLAESSFNNVVELLQNYENLKKVPPKLQQLHHKVRRRLEVLQAASRRTEAVLLTLKETAPDIYEKLDRIKDATGEVTDIYVRAVFGMGIEEGLYGSTNLAQSPHNPHVYHSKFGDYSVSIQIDAGMHAVKYLVHELGHALYQVPHLDAYVKFYRLNYRPEAKERGHLYHDPSNHSVHALLGEYQRSIKLAWRNRKEIEQDEPLLVLDVMVWPPYLP